MVVVDLIRLKITKKCAKIRQKLPEALRDVL